MRYLQVSVAYACFLPLFSTRISAREFTAAPISLSAQLSRAFLQYLNLTASTLPIFTYASTGTYRDTAGGLRSTQRTWLPTFFIPLKMFSVWALYALVAIGAWYLFWGLLGFLASFYRHFLRQPVNFKKRYGEGWVVITGGAEGIGRTFAEFFATRGY